MSDLPPCVHIVGHKNQGKTTLTIELVKVLVGRGLRVGAVKQSPHDHALDRPGSDSARLGEAGAAPWAFLSASGAAYHVPRASSPQPGQLLPLIFEGCELVIVEGGLDEDGPKIEVWRSDERGRPLACERGQGAGIRVLVTDQPAPSGLPSSVELRARDDVERIAADVLRLAGMRP